MGAALHVLHLVNRWEAGGVQQHIRDLSAELRQRGVRVSIAGWVKEGREADPDVLFLPLYSRDGTRKSAAGFSRACMLLRRHARETRVDVLHMHSRYATPLGAGAVRGAGIARVYTAHNTFRDLGSLPWYPKHIICPSAAVRDAFRDSVRDSARYALRVVLHGVRPAAMRQRPGEGSPPLFLFLGRFTPSKGGEVLIDALALLARRGVDGWAAAFVGDGPSGMEWRRRASERGLDQRVRFDPWTSDPQAYLRNARVLVMPSVSLEGLPIAMLEAMAVGCPVIASDLPPFREEFRNGGTGLVFRNHDSEQLATLLEMVLAEPVRLDAMAEAAHAAVLRTHRLSSMADATMAVYREALSEATTAV